MRSPATAFHDERLQTGIRLRFATHGPSDAPAVLMLHGYTDSWFSFSRVLSLMPPDLLAIAPDQRGHGDSDKPVEGYTLDALALDAIALLDALEIPRATVLGHCMGGLVAQRVAEIAPERVSSLMLIATAVTARNAPILELLDAVGSLEDPVNVEFIRDFQSSTIHRAVPTDFFDGVVQSSMKVPASIWKCALRSLVEADVARVPADCPVRILWGDRDGVFSWDEQQVLRRHIPGATFGAFAEVGHALHWEVPEVVVRELTGLPSTAALT